MVDRAALDTTVDAIAVIDRHQIVRSFNRAAERLFGYAAEEIIGRPIDIVLPDPIRAAEDLYLDPSRPAAGGVWREVRGRLRDGTVIALDLSAAEWVAGSRPYLTATMRDAGARKAASQRLAEASRLAMLGRTAGGYVHDFNNMLLVVGSMAEVAREALPPGDEVCEPLELIRCAADRATVLARRLLALGRPTEPRREPVDLARLAGDTLDLLNSTIPSTITVRRHLGETVETVGDEAQLQQIVMNLAINAADAIGDRAGAIEVAVDRAGGLARLRVSDDGDGMPPEFAAKASEPFFTTKPAGRSAGLGLATVGEIAAGHGGGVSIDSAPGLGTRVTIVFPLGKGAPLDGSHPGGRR